MLIFIQTTHPISVILFLYDGRSSEELHVVSPSRNIILLLNMFVPFKFTE